MSRKSKPKILLVDDDKDMCESLADVLTIDSNYVTSYCTQPQEALKKIEKESFDLIILDYKMPEMNGLELMKKIRQLKPKLIIFMLTAFISNELIEQAKREGAQKVLSKFIWPDEILKYIKEAIG
ncbi:MAG: response regulator [Candidatus Omnitrophota bacterium]